MINDLPAARWHHPRQRRRRRGRHLVDDSPGEARRRVRDGGDLGQLAERGGGAARGVVRREEGVRRHGLRLVHHRLHRLVRDARHERRDIVHLKQRVSAHVKKRVSAEVFHLEAESVRCTDLLLLLLNGGDAVP